jgi:hypothetical protein
LDLSKSIEILLSQVFEPLRGPQLCLSSLLNSLLEMVFFSLSKSFDAEKKALKEDIKGERVFVSSPRLPGANDGPDSEELPLLEF